MTRALILTTALCIALGLVATDGTLPRLTNGGGLILAACVLAPIIAAGMRRQIDRR